MGSYYKDITFLLTWPIVVCCRGHESCDQKGAVLDMLSSVWSLWCDVACTFIMSLPNASQDRGKNAMPLLLNRLFELLRFANNNGH